MIKFFRKIRQKLLQEKRFSSYVTYAVGEVLLVVIGILLALQFNNWNNKQMNVKKEIWYLDNIANDMFNQKSGLEDLKKYYTKTLNVAGELLLDFKKQKGYHKLDSLSYRLNELMISYSYPNIDNTYRELLSSGQVSLIKNNDLISDIIDFYLYTAEIETMFNVNQSQVFYGEVYSVLNKFAQVDLSEIVDDDNLVFEDEEIKKYLNSELKKTKNKHELTNAIRNKIVILSDYMATLDESIGEVNKMIKAIDKEITKLK